MNDRTRGIYRIDPSREVAIVPMEHYAARKRLIQQSHSLVAQTTDARGRVPAVIRDHFADWWYDLRRKQNTIYGGLLRFIDVSILAKVPKRILKLIPHWLAEYIDNEYPDHPNERRVA